MGVRTGPVSGALSAPEIVDELVTGVRWLAACDQVRAALRRVSLPVYGGSVSTALAAERFVGAR